jgi:hypothetical protein
MKVEDLIEQLGYMDQDAEVHFEYGYGDHWRTTVAPKVTSVEMGVVQYSDYHRMDKVVEPDWDEEDADEVEGRTVVLIG